MTPSPDEPDRPPAPADYEKHCHADFPFQEMSPEEFAARNAANIACFSLDRFRYGDPKLDEWIQRLAAILNDWKIVNECRKKYLTAAEMQRALERDQEEF